MNINTVQADWITLTSWAKPVYDMWRTMARDWYLDGTGELVKRMQYSGLESRGVFLGKAFQKQRGGEHYMMQASGERAHEVAAMMGHEGKCTRLDVQITLAMPDWWNWRKCKDELDNAEWDGRQRRTKLYESDTGTTVYVGSRTSDLFIRIYEKRDEAQKPFVRFEAEYKGDKAADLWAEAAGGNLVALWPYLAGEADALPVTCHVGWVARSLGPEGARVMPERVQSDGKTLRWLRNQVEGALRRAMNDHDIGPAVRRMVRGWAAEAEYIDAASRNR